MVILLLTLGWITLLRFLTLIRILSSSRGSSPKEIKETEGKGEKSTRYRLSLNQSLPLFDTLIQSWCVILYTEAATRERAEARANAHGRGKSICICACRKINESARLLGAFGSHIWCNGAWSPSDVSPTARRNFQLSFCLPAAFRGLAPGSIIATARTHAVPTSLCRPY